MEHLNEYEDLENLMADLRELGMGECKVYLKIRKSLHIDGSFSKEIFDYIRIDLPRLDKIDMKINEKVIVNELRLKNYDVYVFPNIDMNENIIVNGTHTRIEMALFKVKYFTNNEDPINQFMINFVSEYPVNVEIGLYINGKLEHKESKML